MSATNSIRSTDFSNKDVVYIHQARELSNAAIAKKDVKGVSAFWSDNFVQIVGDGSHTRGKKKIVELWNYMFAHSNPLFERIPDEISIAESGDYAWERGKWSYKTDPFYGNYSAMWRKVNGKWMTQCELYVSLN
jgi:ketosteroid isomerase-like protein